MPLRESSLPAPFSSNLLIGRKSNEAISKSKNQGLCLTGARLDSGGEMGAVSGADSGKVNPKAIPKGPLLLQFVYHALNDSGAHHYRQTRKCISSWDLS